MRRSVIVITLLLGVPAIAKAHVTVNPRASKPGAEEQYTVRVPTEKQVATTSVELEVPDSITVSDVSAPEGATHEEKRQTGRIVTIIWTKEIKPRERAEFTFVAKNPASGAEITWKIHQRYSDGTVSDWSPTTKLAAAGEAAAASAPRVGSSPDEAATIETWLKGYDQAFNAKDLDKLGTFYHQHLRIVGVPVGRGQDGVVHARVELRSIVIQSEADVRARATASFTIPARSTRGASIV